MVTDPKLMVQLQKNDEVQVKCQYEYQLTNPCWKNAELVLV